MKKVLGLACISLLFATCKNDLNVIADWKETTVVYGLLNQYDTAQYIKVNKAFLGEGNALNMAQVYDSTAYGSYLTVSLERIKNGSAIQTIVLQRDSTIPKNTGTFYAPGQVLYKTNAPLFDDSEYTLSIHNTKTGNKVSARSPLVKDFSITAPSSSTVNFTHPTSPFKAKWNSASNGRLYQLVIRFHWQEWQVTDTSIRVNKQLDWVFPTQKSLTVAGGEPMEYEFMGEEFYKYLKTMIAPNSSVYRIPGALDFIFSVAADDFSTYMDVNKPSTSIVQERPEYTNITNGVGIFSARFTKILPNKMLNQRSEDSLFAGQHTYNLNFCSPNTTSVYSCF